MSDSPNRYVRLADITKTLIEQRHNYDILVLAVFSGRSFVVEDIASKISCLLGKRIVMFLHGGAMPTFMAKFPNWTRRVFSRADVIVAPSSFLRRAIEPYGFEARIIPNVIDLSRYTFRHRERIAPRLFWMRSFEQVYNPLMAVRVLARLRSTMHDASLVMGGKDKGLEDAARRLAHSLDLGESVRFPSFLPSVSKIREANAADIFINTNHVDNMPVAVVEAWAMGLPVVATAVGGIPHLITDGETGLLVQDDDDAGMAEAVKHLLKDSRLAGKLSKNGRSLAEQSSWQQVRPQWDRMFEEVMSLPR